MEHQASAPWNAVARSATGIGATPGRRRTGSAVTVPSSVAGPAMARSSATSSGRTSTTRRPVDSANRAVARSAWGSASTVDAEPPGDAQLGEGDGEAALADVVARLHEPGADRRVQPAVAGRRVGIGLRARRRRRRARRARGRGGCRRTPGPCAPSSSEHVARRRQLGGDAAADVGHVGDGGDHERRRHGVALAVGAGVLVVERVLARHERRAVGDRRVVAAAHRGDELAERRRPPRVAPREVVEQGDPVGVGADGDDVADRLVDDGVGHRLGIVQPVATG